MTNQDLPLTLVSTSPPAIEISNDAVSIDDVVDGVRYELRHTERVGDVTADTLNAAYLSSLIYAINHRQEQPSTFRSWCRALAGEIVESRKVIDQHIDLIIESYEKAQQRFDEPVMLLCDERGYQGRIALNQLRDAGIVPPDLQGIAILSMSLDDAIDAVTQREPNEDVVATLKALVADQHSFPLLLYRHGLTVAPMQFVQR